MPLPIRYTNQVLDMHKIWEPEGYFTFQCKIWVAQSEARAELFGKPTTQELEEIKKALVLDQSEIDSLLEARGHETNKLLRLVQGKLSKDAGNYLHKGNTSSDVLDTSLALQIKESLQILEKDFNELLDSLKKLSLKHKNTLQVGRSHGQHAVPQTFGRQVLGWYAEVLRDITRIKHSESVIAYGKCSGEIGTNVFIEPEVEKLALKKLGLEVDQAPTQVISRDRHAEVLSLLAINAGTLERIATDIRLLSITDVGEVREPFEKESQQGSSAMPHKRNPELSERICGLARVIRSAAFAEQNSQALWFERDISHSSVERFAFPDVFEGLLYAVRLMTQVVEGLVVYEDRMLENLKSTYGAIYSPRLLNTLLEKGVSRTQAYDVVKALAQRAMDEKIELLDLALKEQEVADLIPEAELRDLFDTGFYLRNIHEAYVRLDVK
ncbi:MAG: adenylosuccinate lyase [Candidatus Levybacteria bacterium]|nr:adenylosuccinate lyase [Candidatus Levybacteria bacterium]